MSYLKGKYQQLNQLQNENYNSLVPHYIELQTKQKRNADEENNLHKIKTEMTQINDAIVLNAQLQVGLGKEHIGNTEKVIKLLKSHEEYKYIKGIKDNSGKIIENENDKIFKKMPRSIIKNKYR